MGDKFENDQDQVLVEEGGMFLSNCLITSENDNCTAISGDIVLSWSGGFLALQNTIVMTNARNLSGHATSYDNVGEHNLFTGSQIGFHDNLPFHNCNTAAHLPPPVIAAIERLEQLHCEVQLIWAWSRWLTQHLLGSRDMVPAGYIEFAVRAHHTFAREIYTHTHI
jgi:hypothetical protein